MNILLFIFRLINRFVDVDPLEFPKIQQEAKDWYGAIDYAPDAKIKGVKFYIKRFSEFWGTKLALAVVYIFAVKKIQAWMSPANDSEDNTKF